jgi:PTS system ascorbate-specific IIB component
VEHSSVSEAVGCNFDLFVVSRDLESQVKSKPNVVVLDNIVNMEELETKLKAVFEKEV